MDDELMWLREAATQLPELDEGSLRRARERLFAEIRPRASLHHDESLLADLPIDGHTMTWGPLQLLRFLTVRQIAAAMSRSAWNLSPSL